MKDHTGREKNIPSSVIRPVNIFPVIKFGNETWNLIKLLLGYLTKPEKSIIVSEFVQAREMKNWQNAQRKNAENDRLHRENI